jgi:hypothetical protein
MTGGNMAMKWRKSSETLVQKFAELLPQDPRVERRKMFGYPAGFMGGNYAASLPPKNAGRSKSPAKARHSPKRGSAKTRRR